MKRLTIVGGWAALSASFFLSLVAAAAGAGPQDLPRPEHPQPNMVRAEWLSLNGTWEFGETDKDVRAKVAAAIRNGIRPILCVGENAEERQADKTISKVTEQVTSALAGVAAQDPAGLPVGRE